MKLKYYEIDENELLKKTGNEKRVVIKLPEGFINYSSKISEFLSKNGVDAIIYASPVYGACDFVSVDIKTIFIGEAEMPYLKKVYKNIEFVEARYEYDVKFLRKVVDSVGEKIGLASITPFIHKIKEAKKFLEENGKIVYIGKKSRRTKYDGQILGCDFSSATSIANMVDGFILIGDGFFHAIGLAIATRKNVFIANPLSKEIKKCDEMKEKLLKQRYAIIAKAMDAKNFGIIIGEKKGQTRYHLAIEMKKLAEQHGRKASLMMANNITNYIDYSDFDAFVSTACPRVAIDDAMKFKKPVLTPIEFEILLGERDWNNYEFDQIL
ncbi:MAG: diphthamide biosynthesis enzyme Dph2 [Thermoplasmata archaeon]|nr:diphthamide biosynthesis enzyme Dph2 [Thermoplasmata archaeon]